MAKLAANCMLAQRVSSINSLSALCETEGAVIDEIAYAIGLDDRIGPRFLRPSVGFGGSCFRKDVLSLVYLAESRNLPEVAAYWKAVIDINDYQQARFSRKIISALNNTLANKSVAVLGFAYKKNTSDTRNSPAIDVVKQLLDENANVRIYDPKVEEIQIRGDLGLSHPSETANQRLKVCNNTHDACNGVAAIIILTEWDLFRTDKVLLSTRRGTHLASNGVRQDVLSHEKAKDHAIMNVNGIGRCNGGHLSESANSTDSEEYDARPQPGRKGVCSRLEQRIDWKHISSIVQRPRLVFDGRNIVCRSVLEDLGFRVYNIGNAGC